MGVKGSSDDSDGCPPVVRFGKELKQTPTYRRDTKRSYGKPGTESSHEVKKKSCEISDKQWDPCTGTAAKESCGLHGVCTNGTISGYDCQCECDHQGPHCSSIILDLQRLGSPLGMTDGRISAAQIRLMSHIRCIAVSTPGLVCEDIMRLHAIMKFFISSFRPSNIFAEVDLKCPHRITGIDSLLASGELPHFRLSLSDVTGEQFYDAMDACTNKTKV
nr:uncharacterized protein LOC129263554 [Lytechinus pictus]